MMGPDPCGNEPDSPGSIPLPGAVESYSKELTLLSLFPWPQAACLNPVYFSFRNIISGRIRDKERKIVDGQHNPSLEYLQNRKRSHVYIQGSGLVHLPNNKYVVI